MKPKIDYSLYLVTDRKALRGMSLDLAVENAIIGGCTLIQLREKDISTREFITQAMRIKAITQRYGVPLIINDRIDIALAVDADGVHVGNNDMPLSYARKLLGDDKILGTSVISKETAIIAEQAGADYLGVGAMFSTTTKPDADIVSIDELKSISGITHIPIVVIGGISKESLPYFKNVNIDGLAVVSAVLSQQNIIDAARELSEQFCKLRNRSQ